MKPALAMLAIYSLLVLAGCASPAVSINPLYLEKEKPTTEAALEGNWRSEDQTLALPVAQRSGDRSNAQWWEDQTSTDAQRWNVTSDSDGCYRVQVHKQDTDADKKQKELYKTCLVRLQGKLFFDSRLLTKDFGVTTVSPNDLGPGTVESHLVGRIELEKDLLRVAPLSSPWVEKNASEGFRVMQGRSAVITASTADLRKLMTEHAEDDSLWSYAYFCRPEADCKLLATADRLAHYPDDKDVLENAAGLFVTRGDYERAVPLLYHAIQVAPNDSGPHAFLALALLPKRDFVAARRELAEAQKLDQENKDAYDFFIGGTHFLEGNFQEASRTFTRLGATEKEHSAAIILFNYFSLARAGHRKEAADFLAKQTARFVGPEKEHLLLLQAAGRVTNAPWAQPADDVSEDATLLYAENCLVQGDEKAAKLALERIVSQPGMDTINLVAARMELERLNAKPQERVKK
jgi:Flp pilus assembly protein TadD